MATWFSAICGTGCSSTTDQCSHGRPTCCDGAKTLPPSMTHDKDGPQTARYWMRQEPHLASGARQGRGPSESDRQSRPVQSLWRKRWHRGGRPLRSASSPRVDARVPSRKNSKPCVLSHVSRTDVHLQFAWSERGDCTRSQGLCPDLRMYTMLFCGRGLSPLAKRVCMRAPRSGVPRCGGHYERR